MWKLYTCGWTAIIFHRLSFCPQSCPDNRVKTWLVYETIDRLWVMMLMELSADIEKRIIFILSLGCMSIPVEDVVDKRNERGCPQIMNNIPLSGSTLFFLSHSLIKWIILLMDRACESPVRMNKPDKSTTLYLLVDVQQHFWKAYAVMWRTGRGMLEWKGGAEIE